MNDSSSELVASGRCQAISSCCIRSNTVVVEIRSSWAKTWDLVGLTINGIATTKSLFDLVNRVTTNLIPSKSDFTNILEDGVGIKANVTVKSCWIRNGVWFRSPLFIGWVVVSFGCNSECIRSAVCEALNRPGTYHITAKVYRLPLVIEACSLVLKFEDF